jgi:hypothetical protein
LFEFKDLIAMTILRVGSSDKYADNWAKAFGGPAKASKAAGA